MALSDYSAPKLNHVLHHFDKEIANLSQNICNLGEETLMLWALNHEALIDGNLKLASDVIARQSESRKIQLEIEQAIIKLLAKEQPVACDLKFLVSTIKISYEFRNIIEIAHEMAKLILALYIPRHGAPYLNLIVNLSRLDLNVYYVISDLIEAVNNPNFKHSLQLFEGSALIESSVQKEIMVLVDFIQANPHHIRPALIILQMMKALESCSGSCKNMARYCSYIVDGIELEQVIA